MAHGSQIGVRFAGMNNYEPPESLRHNLDSVGKQLLVNVNRFLAAARTRTPRLKARYTRQWVTLPLAQVRPPWPAPSLREASAIG